LLCLHTNSFVLGGVDVWAVCECIVFLGLGDGLDCRLIFSVWKWVLPFLLHVVERLYELNA